MGAVALRAGEGLIVAAGDGFGARTDCDILSAYLR